MKNYACDYNYKCLTQGCNTVKGTVVCPHIADCETFARTRDFTNHSAGRSSYKKIKKGWNHAMIKKQDLRDRFKESLSTGLVCPYCNQPMTLDPYYRNSITIDHVIARGLGGDNSKKNIILCCHDCNQQKNKIEMLALPTKVVKAKVE
jgi:5-methylcytosine-specific restriction endonuclease McrA